MKIKHITALVILCLFLSQLAFTQSSIRVVPSGNASANVKPNPTTESNANLQNLEEDDDDDEEINVATVVPDDFSSSLDMLLYNWAVDKNSTTACKPRPNPFTTDFQYKERLKKLPYVIEMPFNSAVKSFIEIYTQKSRKQVEYLHGLSTYYFPIFEAALEAEKIPLELKYLPIIESALNPKAVSRAGATGIWQFMISTGRMYNLEINSLVDERMDPVKSSKAAAKFLKELYNIYSDWHLAIAAYNCGPGNVNKAIRRADGKQDFWAIYPYLPAETRSYVPIFIAANYMMNYSAEHFLCPAATRLPLLTDTVMVQKRVHMEQISTILNIPIEEVRLLNPQYRTDIIPGDIKPYPLCLPHNYANLFIDKSDLIYAYKANELVNTRREETEIPVLVAAKSGSSSKSKSSARYTYHTVKKGQTLSGIADRYNVSQSRIQRENNLRSSKIRIGQRLRIPK